MKTSKRVRLNANAQKRDLKRKAVSEDVKFFSTSSGGGEPRATERVGLKLTQKVEHRESYLSFRWYRRCHLDDGFRVCFRHSDCRTPRSIVLQRLWRIVRLISSRRLASRLPYRSISYLHFPYTQHWTLLWLATMWCCS